VVPKFKVQENKVRQEELVADIGQIVRSEKVRRLLESSLKREYRFYLDSCLKHAVRGSKDIFLKGIIDHIGQTEPGSIDLVDWKSGKTKSGSLEQLRLYSIWAFEAFKNIDRIRLSLFYLEDDDEKTETVTRDGCSEIREQFLDTVNRIESDKEFEKKRNKRCEYCDFFKICKPFNITI
jgi:CRISPR/Cas system-associated exonuclease Cas4 (RecB family)